MINFSEQINQILRERGLTPSDLARMTGYSPQYIIDLLKNNRRWNETTINKACKALNLEIKIEAKAKNIA